MSVGGPLTPCAWLIHCAKDRQALARNPSVRPAHGKRIGLSHYGPDIVLGVSQLALRLALCPDYRTKPRHGEVTPASTKAKRRRS
jgi:hypothetical protein